MPLSILALALASTGCRDEEQTKPEAEAKASASAADKSPKPDKSEGKKPKRPTAKELADKRKALRERLADKKLEAKPVAKVPVAEGDPENGEFTLEEATKGLPSEGVLVADIQTDQGKLSCELYEDKAPITVANFVGLARGLRAWQKGQKWIKKPLYDGTAFHRVIKGFMIQGGDPEGNGTGGPGYVIPDEIWANAKHDRRGLLCMANRGPNTNGSQFFLMDGAAKHLDGGYTIFGFCTPEEVIEKLAAAEVKGDRAVKPSKITRVTVRRDKSQPKPEASANASSTSPTAGTKEEASKENSEAKEEPAGKPERPMPAPKPPEKPTPSPKPLGT